MRSSCVCFCLFVFWGFFPLTVLVQVLVSNSLASLTGSSAERIYCDNLNVSVCPLTESSSKVNTHTHNMIHCKPGSSNNHVLSLIIVLKNPGLNYHIQI